MNYQVIASYAGIIDTFDCGSALTYTLTTYAETTYNIQIKGTNNAGTVYSNTITLTTPADQAKIRVKINNK